MHAYRLDLVNDNVLLTPIYEHEWRRKVNGDQKILVLFDADNKEGTTERFYTNEDEIIFNCNGVSVDEFGKDCARLVISEVKGYSIDEVYVAAAPSRKLP